MHLASLRNNSSIAKHDFVPIIADTVTMLHGSFQIVHIGRCILLRGVTIIESRNMIFVIIAATVTMCHSSYRI